MAGNKKPRKPHKQRQLNCDPLRRAMIGAGKLNADEAKLLIDPVKECFDALLRGAWTNADFAHLVDCLNVAEVLAGPGFNLLPDHAHKFEAAQQALAGLAARAVATHSRTCYATELAAVTLAIEFHEIQLEFASAGEVARATLVVDRFKRGAAQGNRSKNQLHTTLPDEVTA